MVLSVEVVTKGSELTVVRLLTISVFNEITSHEQSEPLPKAKRDSTILYRFPESAEMEELALAFYTAFEG